MVATTSAATQASEMEKKRRHTLERARANHLSRQLQMRLQYARLKVEHGWHKQTLNEVENLYFHHSHVQHRGPPKPLTVSSSLSVTTTIPPQKDHAFLNFSLSKADINEQMQMYRAWLNSASGTSGSFSAMDTAPDGSVVVPLSGNQDGSDGDAQSSQSNVMEGVQRSITSASEKTSTTAISPDSVIPTITHDPPPPVSVVPSVATSTVACPQPQSQSPYSKPTSSLFSSSFDFSINNFTPTLSSNTTYSGAPSRNTENLGITTISNTNLLTATATSTPSKSGTRKFGTLGTPSSAVVSLNRTREGLFGSSGNNGLNGNNTNARSNNNIGTGANGAALTYDSFWSNHIGARTFASGKALTGVGGDAGHENTTNGSSSGPSPLMNSLLNKSSLGLSSSSPSVRSASPARGISTATPLASTSTSNITVAPTSIDVRHEAMDNVSDTSKSTPPPPENVPPALPVAPTPVPRVSTPLSKPIPSTTFDHRLPSASSPAHTPKYSISFTATAVQHRF